MAWCNQQYRVNYLRCTETKAQETRVLLDVAHVITALLSPASGLDPIELEIV